jgi:hypothetical protein
MHIECCDISINSFCDDVCQCLPLDSLRGLIPNIEFLQCEHPIPELAFQHWSRQHMLDDVRLVDNGYLCREQDVSQLCVGEEQIET